MMIDDQVKRLQLTPVQPMQYVWLSDHFYKQILITLYIDNCQLYVTNSAICLRQVVSFLAESRVYLLRFPDRFF